MFIVFGLVFAFTVNVAEGANIMLNKPTTMTGNLYRDKYASQANDGDTATYAGSYLNNFGIITWQGDLLGLYTVSRILVTCTTNGIFLNNASIGVSTCEDEFVLCGQWPDETQYAQTITFTCAVPKPVRFVRIWRPTQEHFTLAEVQVEGTPAISQGISLKKFTKTQVTAPTTKLTVPGPINCAAKCHQAQTCLAFSFNPNEDPNCFIASDNTTITLAEWVTYKIPDCFKGLTCNTNG